MKFDKRLDLHESEWTKDGKKQPFWGKGAYWFFQVTLPTLVFAIVFAYALNFAVSLFIETPFH